MHRDDVVRLSVEYIDGYANFVLDNKIIPTDIIVNTKKHMCRYDYDHDDENTIIVALATTDTSSLLLSIRCDSLEVCKMYSYDHTMFRPKCVSCKKAVAVFIDNNTNEEVVTVLPSKTPLTKLERYLKVEISMNYIVGISLYKDTYTVIEAMKPFTLGTVNSYDINITNTLVTTTGDFIIVRANGYVLATHCRNSKFAQLDSNLVNTQLETNEHLLAIYDDYIIELDEHLIKTIHTSLNLDREDSE